MKKLLLLIAVIMFSCTQKQEIVSVQKQPTPIKPISYIEVLEAAQKLTISGWKAGLDYDFKTDSVFFDIEEADVTKVGSPDLRFVARPVYDSPYYSKVVVEEYEGEYVVVISVCESKDGEKNSKEACADIGQKLSWAEVEYVLQEQLLLILTEAEKIR